MRRRWTLYYAPLLLLRTAAGDKVVVLAAHAAAEATKTRNADPPRIAIITVGRSGSTLLGSLFNADASVFYVYEPCRRPVLNNHAYDEECAELVERLLSCRLRFPDIAHILFDPTAHVQSHRLSKLLSGPKGRQTRRTVANMGFASEERRTAVETAFNRECRASRAAVAKVIRVQNVPAWVTERMKVVHLVRDPRAVILSQSHTTGFDGRSLATIAKKVCDATLHLHRQLHAATAAGVGGDGKAKAKRVCHVFYEDLCRAPEATLAALYKCLKMGHPPPPSTLHWVAKNMRDDGREALRNSRYTEHRNATDIVLHWAERWGVKKEEVAPVIDAQCGAALTELGYNNGWSG